MRAIAQKSTVLALVMPLTPGRAVGPRGAPRKRPGRRRGV
jgi:hypothetical protein